MHLDKAKDPTGLADGSLTVLAKRLYFNLRGKVNVSQLGACERYRRVPGGELFHRLPVSELRGVCEVCDWVGEMYAMWCSTLGGPVCFVCVECDWQLWTDSDGVTVNLD